MLPRALLGLGPPREATSDLSQGHLATASRDIEPVPPEALLALAATGPRGFWGNSHRWTAHAGSAAILELTAGTSANGNGQACLPVPHGVPTLHAQVDPTTGDRFQALSDMLGRLEARFVETPSRAPRVYGGFAFHAGHRANGPWQGFPTARFTLPAIRLESTPEGHHLAVTTFTGEEAKAAQASAEEILQRVHRRLVQAGRSEPYTPGRMELSVPTPTDGWTDAVEQALDRIHAGTLGKVVLARTLTVESRGEPNPLHTFGRLWEHNPGTHRFLYQPGPGTAFLGAAPELVAAVHGATLHATAVAGSMARGGTVDEDDRLSRALLHSAKDRQEHQHVVDHIRDRLGKVADQVQVGQEPHVLRLNRIQHLETDVYADLSPGQDVLSVLAAIHPTPAVCGTPSASALDFLSSHEPFDRGWYAGPVGWLDTRGDGELAPGLRSAVLHESTWHLFAGAGIVAGSDPEDEWEETGIKFQPMLRALGFGGS